MEPASGVVRTASLLDYDTTPTYELEITATDNAGNTAGARSASFTLTINLNDVNDNYPRFVDDQGTTVTHHTVNIPEDIADSGNVLTVYAMDDDATTPFNEVMFSIDSRSGEDQFAIGTNTGLRTTISNHNIDYEQRTSYTLLVMAEDGGTPSLVAFTVVTVYVNDVNDHSPVFSPSEFPVSISTISNRPMRKVDSKRWKGKRVRTNHYTRTVSVRK